MTLLLHLSGCFWLTLGSAFVVHSPTRLDRGQQQSSLQKSAVIEKSAGEWQSILSDEEFRVLREKGTEAPFSSPWNTLETTDKGVLVCAGCNTPLFSPRTMFDAGTGWPSFRAPISSLSIDYHVDFGLILPRTECLCASCGGHLGHVFDDGPQPTGLRYCMNGVSMQFINGTNHVSADADEVMTIMMQQQQPETEAAQLPLASILPSVAVNLGIAALFATSWIRHEHHSDAAGGGMIELVMENFPLPVAAFYSYSAIKSLLKAKL